MFACNQGGHFSQMMALSSLFGKYDSVLVTDNVRATKDMEALKNIGSIEYMLVMAEARNKGKKDHNSRVYGVISYAKACLACCKIWRKYRPAVIITTGSSIAVGLFLYGKLMGSKLIFIETRAKVYSKTITGKIVGRVADRIYVQWPEMKTIYPTAHFCGTLV